MSDTSKAGDISTEDFFRMIFGENTGYLYIATKVPDTGKHLKNVNQFSQKFFQWPSEKSEAISYISKMTSTHEVYYGPALFKTEGAKSEDVKSSHVFWCEFDGEIPTDLSNIPEPSIRVRSSMSGREHWYWQTEQPVDPKILELVNRNLAYALDADTSGWDACQILRPIHTKNHKRDLPVVLKSASGMAYGPEDFAHISAPPPAMEAPVPDSIPPIEDVIPRYKFQEEVWDLFKNGMPEGKRSEGLMSLGYYLCEMQLEDTEVFSLLLNADDRWGKFSGRSDQYKRLMEIVVRARIKYPSEDNETLSFLQSLVPVGFTSLTKMNINISWVYKGLLHDKGYMLLTGPSGVGKTQFSLEAAEKAVLGQSFLGFENEKKDARILFLSLEMSLVEIKEFVELHRQKYSETEQATLEEMFRIIPVGEPLYFTQKPTQDWLEQLVKDGEYTGVIIDSLGSMTEGSLSEEQNTKNLMDWNDRFRNRLNIFTWFIHHHRKANAGNSTPNDLGDVYGSQYITARSSSVVSLWDLGSKGTIRVKSLKTRFSKRFEPFEISRDAHLTFSPKLSGITILDTQSKEYVEGEPLVEKDTSAGIGSGF